MKKNLFENLKTFTRGALFNVMVSANSSLVNTAIAFMLLEMIWLVATPFFQKKEGLLKKKL